MEKICATVSYGSWTWLVFVLILALIAGMQMISRRCVQNRSPQLVLMTSWPLLLMFADVALIVYWVMTVINCRRKSVEVVPIV